MTLCRRGKYPDILYPVSRSAVFQRKYEGQRPDVPGFRHHSRNTCSIRSLP